MTEENRTYITHLKVTDVPWHRLTTAYGRGTEFPTHLAVLERMEDMETVKKSLYELTTNMEHQSTLWHATPFGMVFLSRILEKALAESGRNPAAHFLAGELLDFFACILQCFHDGDEMEHAEPLPLFSDLLKEEYLWSEEYDEEEDEMRYEEDEVFPDDLFYSFYYYSWQAVKAYCGATMPGKVHKTAEAFSYGAEIQGGKDPWFGLELWFLTSFQGKPVWALNREHLAHLIGYLSADLREKPSGRQKKTQADHLPTFMKTAKNRERIVKLLKKLQEG